MADSQNASDLLVNETANATVNGTGRASATREGLIMAYGSLVVMAIAPIIIGSLRSIDFQNAAKKKAKESGEDVEKMSTRDAAMFPVIASGALLGLYLFFTIFSKEYVNLLLSIYFFGLGTLALESLISPLVAPYIPATLQSKTKYRFVFSELKEDVTETKEEEEQEKSEKEQSEKEDNNSSKIDKEENRKNNNNKEEPEKTTAVKPTDLMFVEFSRVDLACLTASAAFGIWYIWKKHWIANNVFGFSFAIKGIEMLSLNSVTNGMILLGGLFLYDVFWVFGTNVMVTVAKSFDAPIKLVFPMDFLERGIFAQNFSMLGLGDIVIPGIFIALLLRFEEKQKQGSRVYFRISCLAYLAGLVLTVVVMHVFNAAQPALLYLVPACLTAPAVVAVLKGEVSALLGYEDHPTEEKKPSEAKKDN
eukprot:m.41852 g.41852  ORF g.41852 m.41852 type:complete len:420 (+) comp33281_c0_seq2:33-1292(+)